MPDTTHINIEQAIALVAPHVNAWRERGPKPAINIRQYFGWNTRGARVIDVDADGITVSGHYAGEPELLAWHTISSLTICGGCNERHYTLIEQGGYAETVLALGWAA